MLLCVKEPSSRGSFADMLLISKMKANRSYLLIVLSCMLALTAATTDPDDIIINRPVIFPQTSEIILQHGQNFTLTCKSDVPIQFMQQQVTEDDRAVFQKKVLNRYEKSFEVILELYNVDEFAIGYYACFDDTVNSYDVLENLFEEPTNNEHVAYFYIYVNGTDSLFAPFENGMIIDVDAQKKRTLIDCRPATPDIKVELQAAEFPDFKHSFSPKLGFTVDNSLFKDESTICVCSFNGTDSHTIVHLFAIKTLRDRPRKPVIKPNPWYFIKGENFTINCTLDMSASSVASLSWRTPRPLSNETFFSVSNEYQSKTLYWNAITVLNATKEDEGDYICEAKNNAGHTDAVQRKMLRESNFIILEVKSPENPGGVLLSTYTIHFLLDDYPPARIEIFRDGLPLPNNKTKYDTKTNTRSQGFFLKINNLSVQDTGNYTVVASNQFESKSASYMLRRRGPPVVRFDTNAHSYLINVAVSFRCEVIGFPLPQIIWIFEDKDGRHSTEGNITELTAFKAESILQMIIKNPGNLTCLAKNILNTSMATKTVLVHEINDGFGIENEEETWFPEAQDVRIVCKASVNDYVNATWYKNDSDDVVVNYHINDYSHVSELQIDKITLEQSGRYTCRGEHDDGSENAQTITVTVEARRKPVVLEPSADIELEVRGTTTQFTCQADGVPLPQIDWYKDGVKQPNNHTEITLINHFTLNSTYEISNIDDEMKGKYECVAYNSEGDHRRFFNVTTKGGFQAYFGIIAIVFFAMMAAIAYLWLKVRKEKLFRKELAAAGLLYFKEGVTKSLNPDLGINEQAELLPYDEKFEFPIEKLIQGTKLGEGAFGVVYKAEARGIINAEESTTVAVKTIKKDADNICIKALAAELKIMVHLGRHINIVNLLGACTKNVGKRELAVIVEYCPYGNIHNYLQKHSAVFIDQLTNNEEKTMGNVNDAFLHSGGSVMGTDSDYYSSNVTQVTGRTSLNSTNTNRKVSESGYIQPDWGPHYTGESTRPLRSLCSRDLLAWAFQIARGMEYLAMRKVLHGDLAARNILLAEDNVVKICDFGLSRSIYKNDEYLKKGSSPLPVKWLAIECMTDRIFSTQSDVWSYGVVLWELFSLAKTPYPNIKPNDILAHLTAGNRLEKPKYANDELYDLMKKCWETKPTARPSFSVLQEKVGSFLEDNERNYYVDLNAGNSYNTCQQDYLDMVRAPDYNNMVTPSPQLNSTSFFPLTPTQLKHDEDGYLQMVTPSYVFSPRNQGSKFDFDARKFHDRTDSNNVDESTPMLTLSNLTVRSSSESDHECSPHYQNTCPTIDEETNDDSVFEMNQNNAKNLQNTVTNQLYITVEADVENKPNNVRYTTKLDKKPNDITNTYSNVPNGLVRH